MGVNIMKKVLALISILTIAILASGCGRPTTNSTNGGTIKISGLILWLI